MFDGFILLLPFSVALEKIREWVLYSELFNRLAHAVCYSFMYTRKKCYLYFFAWIYTNKNAWLRLQNTRGHCKYLARWPSFTVDKNDWKYRANNKVVLRLFFLDFHLPGSEELRTPFAICEKQKTRKWNESGKCARRWMWKRTWLSFFDLKWVFLRIRAEKKRTRVLGVFLSTFVPQGEFSLVVFSLWSFCLESSRRKTKDDVLLNTSPDIEINYLF